MPDQIDSVDAILQRLGFSLFFPRTFEDSCTDLQGAPLSAGSTSAVVVDLETAYALVLPLRRVDMTRSDLLHAAFIEPELTMRADNGGVHLDMFNCDGKARRYTQNHVASGFLLCVKSRHEMPDLASFLKFANTVSVK